MRAVVTGAAGFIGGHLTETLLEAGVTVVGVDRLPRPDYLHGIRWYESEIQRVPSTFTPFRPDVIFHLASPVGPVGVLNWAGRIVPEVIETSETVARWALVNNCPLVDVSTSEVYGSGGSDSEDDPCTFQAPTSARKEYAVAKLAAETMLRNMAGLDLRIIRPFNVAGPRQSAVGGFVLPRLIAQARQGVPLTVYEPGTQRRAFTHVLDVADGLVACLDWPAGVYNLGARENETTIGELAQRVLGVMGLTGSIEVVDPKALHGPAFREAPDKLPSAEKAKRLGWRPSRSLSEIIRDAAA